MDALSLASVLDALGKFGTLGAAGLMIWMLLTEKVVPKARMEEMRKSHDEDIAEIREQLKELRADRQKVIDRLRAERDGAIQLASDLAQDYRRMADNVDAMRRVFETDNRKAANALRDKGRSAGTA